MLIKICQICKMPFKTASFPYAKFCSVECVNEAYTNRLLDQDTIDYAVKLLNEDISQEREIDTQALRELYFMEILKINRLVSQKECEGYKKDILSGE